MSQTRDLDKIFPDIGMRELVQTKDMYAGSSSKVISREYVVRENPRYNKDDPSSSKYSCDYETVEYAPRLEKAIDEPLVNVADHLVRNPKTCTYLRVDYVKENGRIRITNDGPGMPVGKLASGMWSVQRIVSEYHKGSNMKEDPNSIIGGTNGLGVKLTNSYSKNFIVETVDNHPDSKLYYHQVFSDNNNHAAEPTIIKLTAANKKKLGDKALPHTTISFILDYENLGYKKYDENVYKEISNLIRTRLFYLAAYLGMKSTGKKGFNVYFNSDQIPVRSMETLAKAMFSSESIMATILGKKNKAPDYPMEVVVVAKKNTEGVKLGNINGCLVTSGGVFSYLEKEILKSVETKIMKQFKSDTSIKFDKKYILDNMLIMVNASMRHELYSWDSQRKSHIDIRGKNTLAGFTFPPKFVTELSDLLSACIFEKISEKSVKKTKKKVDYDKFTDAFYAGKKKHAANCMLVMFEGDSAGSQVEAGITSNPDLNIKKFGRLSTGGVTINVRKECEIIQKGRHTIYKKTKTFNNNQFIPKIMNILGLDYKYKYEPGSPTYAKEMSELRYGAVLCCLDQDDDGKGQIMSLILGIFLHFWPNLVKQGFIKWYSTPILRAYPKAGGNVHSFHSDLAYNEWIKQNNINTNNYEIHRYKGLATHTDAETKNMFKDFYNNIFTFTWTDDTMEYFDKYMAKDSTPRKENLSSEPPIIDSEEIKQMYKTREIPCSLHFKYNLDPRQRSDIKQKFRGIVGGRNESGAKILDGVIKTWANKTGEMRVSQLGGSISKIENYHHGEKSLMDSISKLGFLKKGGIAVPIILPIGQFGSVKTGNKGAGSPRYIHAKANKRLNDLIYPNIDYYMLDFNFDEGIRSEPKTFIPVIPMSVIEHENGVGTGWNYCYWGRDPLAVIRTVKMMINSDKNGVTLPITEPPINTYGHNGEIRYAKGQQYSMGCYEHIMDSSGGYKDIIIITELPLRTYVDDYIEIIKKKEHVSRVESIGDADNVKIEVMFNPGTLQPIVDNNTSAFFTGVEEYLLLRKAISTSQINMTDPNDKVIKFDNYADIIKYWYPYRRELYVKRANRMRIKLRLKVLYYENICRYVENVNDYKIARRTEDDVNELLAGSGFVRFDHNLMNNPKFIKNEDYERTVLDGPKSTYDYLLNMSYRKTLKSELVKHREKLTLCKNELRDHEIKCGYITDDLITIRCNFPGDYMWKEELDKIYKTIEYGRKTNWQYESANKYTL